VRVGVVPPQPGLPHQSCFSPGLRPEQVIGVTSATRSIGTAPAPGQPPVLR